jgi:16S rRNA (cytosine1402-N4)-methyltransferase
LAEIIRSVIHVSPRDKIDPSTRTFQALRIAVNDELGELESVLEAAEKVLKVGGRLVVVTFHSLEDRIVKNFLNERARPAPSPSRHMPMAYDAPQNRLSFSLVTKKPVLPTESEMKINPRSRSAKLRAAIRLEAA